MFYDSDIVTGAGLFIQDILQTFCTFCHPAAAKLIGFYLPQQKLAIDHRLTAAVNDSPLGIGRQLIADQGPVGQSSEAVYPLVEYPVETRLTKCRIDVIV